MNTSGSLDWLLDDLVTRVANVDKAVILSRDGLAIGASSGLAREDAELIFAGKKGGGRKGGGKKGQGGGAPQ